MSTYDLGTARGTIELDASSLGRASASLGFMANRMLILGGAAVAGFGFAVKSAADFEEQLSRFGAVSDTNKKDMEAIRQKALQLGRDSAFGAREVVQGFVELAKSGLTAKEVLGGVGDAAVYLAAAGEIDMARSTEVLVNVMRQFDLPASQAVHVANLLAGAANASTSEVDDLANSLRYAGPVAAMAGVSIDDTATVLALFANAGIKGSQAGTTMRGMLLGIAATTPKAEKTLRALNIVTADGTNRFYDMNGALKPMPEVFGILSDAMKGLTPHQQTVALNSIFQRRALTGAALAAHDGTLGFMAMRKEMEKTTAQDVMNKKLDNLNGSIKILKASLETFAITIGENFQGPLKATADFFRGVTNELIKLDPMVLEIGGYVLFAFGAFLLLGGILFKVTQYTIQSYRAFKDLAGALKIAKGLFMETGAAAWSALGPLLIIVAAIALIAAVAYFTYKKWDQIWGWIKDHPAYAIIIGLLISIINPLILVGFIIGALAKNWRWVWEHMKEWTAAAWEGIKSIGQSILDFFTGPFLDFFKVTLPNFFKSLPGKFASVGRDVANALVRAFHAVFDNFPYKVGFVLGFVIGAILKWSEKLSLAMWKAFWDLLPIVISWGLEMVNKAIDVGLHFLETMQSWMLDMAAKTPGWLLHTWEKLIEWGELMWNKMIDIGVQLLDKGSQWALDLGPHVLSFLADLPGKLFDMGLEFLKGLLDGLNQATGGVLDWAAQIPRDIVSAVWIGVTGMFNAGVAMIQGLWDGLKSLAEHVKNWVEDFAHAMVEKIKDPLSILSPSRVFHGIGQNIMQGLQLGLEGSSGKVLKSMGDFAGKIAPMMGGVTAGATSGNQFGNSGGSRVSIAAEINVHGVSDPVQAKKVGEAAYEGFSDALSRRQLQVTARTI